MTVDGKFVELFHKATGHAPYPFQSGFAEANDLPHLLRVPTGAGKTATSVLGWLWRRLHRSETTPRRLVYCLPMRVLVEQSYRESKKWLGNLWLTQEIDLHLLMGGAESEPWHLHPERPAILIGTQDMLLSRTLNRGYRACLESASSERKSLGHIETRLRPAVPTPISQTDRRDGHCRVNLETHAAACTRTFATD